MKNIHVSFALVTAILFCCSSFAEDAAEAIERSRKSTLLPAAQFKLEIQLIAPDGDIKTRKLSSYTKLQKNGFDNQRITGYFYPPEAKGIATLLIEHASKEDDLWVYVPSIKKTRRILQSSKKDSFMGTDLSYGDVIGYQTAEWVHKNDGEEKINGINCKCIVSVPVNESIMLESGYQKRRTCIDTMSYVPIEQVFWGEDGAPLKKLQVLSFAHASDSSEGFYLKELQAENIKTGHKTFLRTEEFKLLKDIPDSRFSANSLEQEDLW